MEKIYDICAKTGSYVQNGQTKNRYVNVGSIVKDNNGNPFMLLNAHFNPAGIERKQGSDNIILSLFKPKNTQQPQPQPQPQTTPPLQQNNNDFDDWPVPF